MSKAYIGVGGNLGNVVETFFSAFEEIDKSPNISSVRLSSLYESKPLTVTGINSVDQPLYVNAVAELETSLNPNELLTLLQETELRFGRVRTEEQWASRTLDLDILLFDDLQISSDRLTVPHAGMLVRDFVLEPLFEIAPSLNIAGYGALVDALESCENRGLTKLETDVKWKYEYNRKTN